MTGQRRSTQTHNTVLTSYKHTLFNEGDSQAQKRGGLMSRDDTEQDGKHMHTYKQQRKDLELKLLALGQGKITKSGMHAMLNKSEQEAQKELRRSRIPIKPATKLNALMIKNRQKIINFN